MGYHGCMSGIAGEQAGQRSHARRNHELLVAAAREVFAERGVEASLEEIARRAGVGTGTLYRHFATRDALVEAVFERRIGELIAVAEASAADPDGWHALVTYLEQTLEVQAGDRLLKDVFLRSPPGTGRVEQAREELRTLLEQILERAREQKTLRPDFTLADLTLLFWSFATLIDATAAVEPCAWRRHLHWLLDGLRAEAATPQSVPALSRDQLSAAVDALRARRLGGRGGGAPAKPLAGDG
jgi:AcrR family transcriptional regulator